MNDLLQSVVYGGTVIAVGDQTDPPELEVSTVAGVNDLLAIIDVLASPDAWGTFDVTFDVGVLELFDQNGSDIPDLGQILITNAEIIVPDPATILLLMPGLTLLVRQRRRVQG